MKNNRNNSKGRLAKLRIDITTILPTPSPALQALLTLSALGVVTLLLTGCGMDHAVKVPTPMGPIEWEAKSKPACPPCEEASGSEEEGGDQSNGKEPATEEQREARDTTAAPTTGLPFAGCLVAAPPAEGHTGQP